MFLKSAYNLLKSLLVLGLCVSCSTKNNPAFSGPQPVLILDYPKGGEHFSFNDTVKIRYHKNTDSVGTVMCYWSCDDGKTWWPINVGDFIWIPSHKISSSDPDPWSHPVILLLCDYSNPRYRLISKQIFIDLPPPIVLDYPVGNEVFAIKDTITLRFKLNSDSVKTVSFSFSINNGTTWHSMHCCTRVEERSLLSDSARWLPANEEIAEAMAGCSVLVQIRDANSPNHIAITKPFFIKPFPSFRLSFPSGGEQFMPFDTVRIKYSINTDSVKHVCGSYTVDSGVSWHSMKVLDQSGKTYGTLNDSLLWILQGQGDVTHPDPSGHRVMIRLQDSLHNERCIVSDVFIINRLNIDPARIDNRNKYLPSMISQLGPSCGVIAVVYYLYTYEINRLRNRPAADISNQYAYGFAYHFINEGKPDWGSSEFLFGTLEITKSAGAPTAIDFGSINDGFPTKWMTGYDRWYRTMQSRISFVDSIVVTNNAAIDSLKAWLRGNSGSAGTGRIAATRINTDYIVFDKASGTTMCNAIVIKWNNYDCGHGLVVVGYDDSAGYDSNNDGKITNTIDITNDGIVDIRDYEAGSFLLLDPQGKTWGDNGCYFAPYRLMLLPISQNGLNGTCIVYLPTLAVSYKPLATFKIIMTHNCRNKIKLIPGFSNNITDKAPQKQILYEKMFSFAGGEFPMQGKGRDSTIEIGLDVSELFKQATADSVTYFFDVISKGGKGSITSFSYLDYSQPAMQETVCPMQNVPLDSGLTRLYVKVPK